MKEIPPNPGRVTKMASLDKVIVFGCIALWVIFIVIAGLLL